ENVPLLKHRWQRRLKMLRIECELLIVDWDEPVLGPFEIDLFHATGDDKRRYFGRVNQFVRSQSEHSDLVFLYLPPPSISLTGNQDYLRHLTTITEHLPPTILVHGISEINSGSI